VHLSARLSRSLYTDALLLRSEDVARAFLNVTFTHYTQVAQLDFGIGEGDLIATSSVIAHSQYVDDIVVASTNGILELP
jgi:hypothetical protein